jgi:hypothetical protein
MDAKQRRLVVREMARLGLPIATTTPNNIEGPGIPTLTERLFSFIEQPLFLAALGIIGGITGLIYTPFLSAVVLCIILAFHRAKVVVDKSWKIQLPSYVLAFGRVAHI